LSFTRFLFWLILVLAIGLLPQQKAAAQKIRGDAVYLKNGSIITGRIMQNDSLNGLKIANECGIWLINPGEFDSIGVQTYGRYFTAKPKGYTNISSAGLLFGYENIPVPSITMVHAYKFSQGLLAGIGLGYEYFDWGVLPLFADARYYFYDEGFSPYIFGQAGYSITLERKPVDFWGGSQERTFGGPMLSAGAGIRAGVSKHSAFTLSIAYRFQKLSYESFSNWEPETQRIVSNHYNRIAVTIGFLFE
jgi:hypothetical protein